MRRLRNAASFLEGEGIREPILRRGYSEFSIGNEVLSVASAHFRSLVAVAHQVFERQVEPLLLPALLLGKFHHHIGFNVD